MTSLEELEKKIDNISNVLNEFLHYFHNKDHNFTITDKGHREQCNKMINQLNSKI